MTHYADVILPLPLEGVFTYSLPAGMEQSLRPGCRVVVSFGQKKIYTALVVRLHQTKPQGDFEIKEVIAQMDDSPIVLPEQLRLWKWISQYYLCSIGDVYKAALPAGMKLESESCVRVNPAFEAFQQFTEDERTLWRILYKSKEYRVRELEKKYTKPNIVSVLHTLMEKKAVEMKESLQHTYKPKTEEWVELTEPMKKSATFFKVQTEHLARSEKQSRLFQVFMELTDECGTSRIHKARLLAKANVSNGILRTMIGKNIFRISEEAVTRLGENTGEAASTLPPLSEAQTTAYQQITQAFQSKTVCLLHGVTASGKTEIYIHLIKKVLEEGKQVLYLLPEIALTTQITERLRRVFGSQLGIYHSKYSDAERVEIWQKQLSSTPYPLLLGVRSSVFLPFQRLGLVIVDEEHENTYKQQDPAPRYHARNTAIMMATWCKAHVLLGTATPSIESYHNAQEGKYGLVSLTQRFRHIELPEISVIDMQEAQRKKQTDGYFSHELIHEIRQTLQDGEQVILFQNRRGYAPVIECKTCGWVPHCPHCDVALTYHKRLHALTCHYCGYTTQIPSSCPSCGETNFFTRGFGTEKVEDKVQELFPQAVIARLDLDTARTRTAYERIFANFASGKTNILIGTQMVSKGLDFAHVRVVGILNADTMLNYPDFRAYEKAFQMLEQVAGRAGRAGKRGRVLLQTKNADLPLIDQVVHNDYQGMFQSQLAERKLFHYPPYTHLIYIYLKHRDSVLLDHLAQDIAAKLRQLFGPRILGPDKPVVARIQSLFIRTIILKIENTAPLNTVRHYLKTVKQEADKSLVFYYDMDPL